MLAQSGIDYACLCQIRYSSLVMILIMDTVGLSAHDQYVCHSYRDPFQFRAPGYRETDVVDGRINPGDLLLPTVPETLSATEFTSDVAKVDIDADHGFSPNPSYFFSRNSTGLADAPIGKTEEAVVAAALESWMEDQHIDLEPAPLWMVEQRERW